MRLETVGALVVLSAVILAVVSRNMENSTLTAGLAGLAITYALGVTSTLKYLR